jgi:DNA gyrase/topoisomerase IV subunit B
MTTRRTRRASAPLKGAPVSKAKGQAYSAESIKVLRGLEGVRKKPGMYLGERGDHMVYRAVKEFLDNGIDEFYAGRNTTVELYVDIERNVYYIADFASGIPTEYNEEAKKSTVDVVFTELHGGGKFDDLAYKNSSGTHGVGAACGNAVAKSLRVWTHWKKVWHFREYAKGQIVGNSKLERVKSPPADVMSRLHMSESSYGTIIEFSPDQTICSEDATNARIKEKKDAILPLRQTIQWMKMISLMNPGIVMVVCTSTGKKYKFVNKGDIRAVIDKIVEEHELSTVAKPFMLQSEKIDCTLQWTSHDESDLFKTYVNCSPTRDYGKHYDGFMAAMGRVLQKLKGPKDKFKTVDAVAGMVGILNFKMSEPEFSSQTKDRLTSHVNKDVEEAMIEPLEEYFTVNKTLAKTVIKRATTISKGREDLKKVMKSVSEVKKTQRGMLLPNILTTADSARPHEREIYLVEGDSAGGTANKARDPSFQEVFKLRGKLTNAVRTDIGSLLKSPVVQNLLVALGVDLRTLDLDADNLNDIKFSCANLRVGTVMILTDADTDGGHISVLLMSAIQRLLPDLYSQGRVFVVKSPLFLATHKDKRYFGMTLDECRANLPANSNAHITRAKGLGELEPEELYDTAFDPKARMLYKVKPPQDDYGMDYFLAITGKASAPRKELLGLVR